MRRLSFITPCLLAACQPVQESDLTTGLSSPVEEYAIKLASPELCINEFMASNAWSTRDDTGERADWIELYNLSEQAIDLDGWSITDDLDDKQKHTLKGVPPLPAGGYVLLWADDDLEEGGDHLGFKLSAEAEAIGIYRPDGTAVDTLEYFNQYTDWSSARMPDGSPDWIYDGTPTPWGPNDE